MREHAEKSVETADNLRRKRCRSANMAPDGFSNHEIGAQLFISTRIVEYHLRRVSAKVD
jgi:DNA-binding NarL/FixJ family response regulator